MSKRLTRSQWLDHGIEILAANGFGLLKAGPLAKTLGVTRGSFYWHFKDIRQFHQELLARWQAQACDKVIVEIDGRYNTADRLVLLLRKAMASNQKLERAIRSWALHDKAVAVTVNTVDRVRLNYIVEILKSSGIAARDQKPRASIIYWAWLGRMMVENREVLWTKNEINRLSDLYLS